MDRVRLVVELDPAHKNAFVGLCEEKGHSQRFVINKLIEEWVANERKRTKPKTARK